MNAEEIDIATELQRTLRNLTRATIALWFTLFVVVVSGAYVLKQQSDDSQRQSARNTGALCALREDLERRVAASQDFLIKNPRGFPGIPLATLQKSITDQQRSIVALSGLHCAPASP